MVVTVQREPIAMKHNPDIEEPTPISSEAANPTEPTAIKVTPQNPYAKKASTNPMFQEVPPSGKGYVILGVKA
jgi:hypothetical protein